MLEPGVAKRMVESIVRDLVYGRSHNLRNKSEDAYISQD